MESAKLKSILESLIFASAEPLSIAVLATLLETTGVGRSEVKQALQELTDDYKNNETKGLLLREVGGGYQFVTKPELGEWVQKLHCEKPKSLSQAALETLAILAYRQPIVRSELEAIRGVDSGGVLKTLLERGFIKILGRREEAGQPLIYGTTEAFLELFHLRGLEELPSMKEIEELVQGEAASREGGIREGEEPTAAAWDSPEEGPLPLTEEEQREENQAISDLESGLKDLRKLGREVFPKAKSEEAATASPEEAGSSNEDTSETDSNL